MLHILWILLKFILILLGILLALVLLLVLLVLFCPVRYKANASKETDSFKEARAAARVSWLFGAAAFEISYIAGELNKEIRIFGIPVLKLLKKRSSKKKDKAKKIDKTKQDVIEETSDDRGRTEVLQESAADTNAPTAETVKEKGDSIQTVSEQKTVRSQSPEKRRGNPIRSFLYRIRCFFADIRKRLSGLRQKIHNLKLTGERFYAKIRWWKRFLTHPRTKEAIALVREKLIRLIKHILPTKISGDVHFSLSDPANTGKVLAILGMTVPFHKNCVRVTPDFEDRNEVLGSVSMKGRIYGFVVLKTALQIYFNKNIKFVIKKWKKHKEVSYGR